MLGPADTCCVLAFLSLCLCVSVLIVFVVVLARYVSVYICISLDVFVLSREARQRGREMLLGLPGGQALAEAGRPQREGEPHEPPGWARRSTELIPAAWQRGQKTNAVDP